MHDTQQTGHVNFETFGPDISTHGLCGIPYQIYYATKLLSHNKLNS